MNMLQNKTSGAAPNRNYEDFEPPLEWVKENGFDILLVFLPGFQKERLRIQITSARNLKINGERPIGGSIWRRFSKEFPIPADYDTNQISAKFEGGILYVKVPKKEAPPSPSGVTPHVKLPQEAATSTIDKKTDEKLAEDKTPSARVSQQKEGHDDKGKEDTSHDVHKKASKDGEVKTSSSDAAAAGVTQKDKHDESEAMKKHEYGKHVSESVDEKTKEKEAKEKSKASSGQRIKQSGEGSVGARPRRQSYKESAQGLDTGFKINPRKVVNLGLIASFLLVLVLYVKNTFKKIEESTIGEL